MKPNASARARALRKRHPHLTIAEIAERTGLTHGGATDALKASGTRGRPSSGVRKTRVVLVLDDQQIAYVDDVAEREGRPSRAAAVVACVDRGRALDARRKP